MFKTEKGEVLEYDITKKILVPSKKNNKEIITNKRTGKMQVVGSRQYIKWQERNKKVFREFHEVLYNKGIKLPLSRCKVKALFYFPDSKKRDLTNKFETIADELVAHGIILDDPFQVLKPIMLDGFVCRERPRTEIYITIIEPGDPGYDWDITSPKFYEDRKKRLAIKAKIRRAQNTSAE